MDRSADWDGSSNLLESNILPAGRSAAVFVADALAEIGSISSQEAEALSAKWSKKKSLVCSFTEIAEWASLLLVPE